MILTPDHKAYIDGLSHYELLEKIRFAPVGDPMMQGETGVYWIQRRDVKRDQNPGGAVADSKQIGWGS